MKKSNQGRNFFSYVIHYQWYKFLVFFFSFLFLFLAAHCLIGFPKGAYFIRLGDHHSEVREDSEIEIFIENWYIHEEFRKGQLMNNDIAVVLLKNPIQFTNFIQPICLPEKETAYEAGKNCTISGWGSIQYGKSSKFELDNIAIVKLLFDKKFHCNSQLHHLI